jgi:hypothetical protein
VKNTEGKDEADMSSLVFQEGIPLRIMKSKSRWNWHLDVSYQSFVVYKVNGDIVRIYEIGKL